MRLSGTIAILLVVGFFIGSCTQRIQMDQNEPDNLIHRDTMVDIIVDLRVMDAILFTKQRSGEKNLNQKKYFLNKSILTKYQITRPQFDSSFMYYQQDLDLIDGIFADAITKLTILKSEQIEE